MNEEIESVVVEESKDTDMMPVENCVSEKSRAGKWLALGLGLAAAGVGAGVAWFNTRDLRAKKRLEKRGYIVLNPEVSENDEDEDDADQED